MKRLLLLSLVGVSMLLGSAADGVSVVGGTVTQVQAAPWTVSIRQSIPGGALLCTGSILDAFHILTAAHCVFDQNNAPAPAASFTVRAGISNYNTPLATDVEQDRSLSSYRVHPGYSYSTTVSPDDVAVLTLSAPLDLGGPAVQQAGPPPSTAFPAATTAQIAGFGRQTPFSANGTLNSTAITVDPQGYCGGYANTVVPYDNAIAFCGYGSTSAICSGDSGSALVTTDTHSIIGVASAAPTSCSGGTHGVYVNAGAPEILSFIQGNDHPVIAPRQNANTFVNLFADPPLQVGSKLRCESGNWDNSPTITYAFIDSEHNRILQQGQSGTLVLNADTAGDTISCRAIATNPGGTAILETTSTTTVGGVPKLVIEHIPTIGAVRGKATKVLVWIDPATGVSGKFGVCVTPPSRVAKHACASRRVSSGGGRILFQLSLRVKQTAPVGTAPLSISAVAGVSKAEAKAFVRVAKK